MNYIVFDLEWNQCPDGKEKEIKEWMEFIRKQH